MWLHHLVCVHLLLHHLLVGLLLRVLLRGIAWRGQPQEVVDVVSGPCAYLLTQTTRHLHIQQIHILVALHILLMALLHVRRLCHTRRVHVFLLGAASDFIVLKVETLIDLISDLLDELLWGHAID